MRPHRWKERPPPTQHRDGRCGSKAVLNQVLSTGACVSSTVRTRAAHSTGHSDLLTFLQFTCCPKSLEKETTIFWKEKTKTKISQSTPEKTASHTWNVTRMGFQLKHGKPLVSVSATTLDSAPSFVLGRAKQKWWADKWEEVSFNKNSLLKKRKIEHSRFLFTITPHHHHNST